MTTTDNDAIIEDMAKGYRLQSLNYHTSYAGHYAIAYAILECVKLQKAMMIKLDAATATLDTKLEEEEKNEP